MKNSLQLTLLKFLNKYWLPPQNILLGLSGGPDSMALFFNLIPLSRRKKFSLFIAHVDHGWREESAKEADSLYQLCKEYDLPFHLKKITAYPEKENLEDYSREQRLQFFKELTKQYNCQAVVLGHHANDQVEVILKRMFEGAYFPSLKGMQESTRINDLQIWRPFLSVKKEELISFLQGKQLPFFTDATNLSPQFLRGKMRTEILPFLENKFGKKIQQNLLILGKEAEEYKKYFSDKIVGIMESIVVEEDRIILDFSKQILHSLEIKHLLKSIGEKYRIGITRELAKNIEKSLVLGKGMKTTTVQSVDFSISKRKLQIKIAKIPRQRNSSVVEESRIC